LRDFPFLIVDYQDSFSFQQQSLRVEFGMSIWMTVELRATPFIIGDDA
jgi:hypothetical protein